MGPSTVTRDGTVVGRGERKRPVVLLVDDYKDCRDMYGAGLEYAGFEVVTARDGFEALELARTEKPDLILMDLGLPGIDGCETTRLLRQDPRTAAVLVVALTAQQVPNGPCSIDGQAFDDVIFKPCLPDALAERVARVLVGRKPQGVMA